MFTCTDHASATTCDGVTRRDFLSAGALSAIGLTLPGFAKLKAAGRVDPKKDGKSCIMIFNLGAPSQQDLWDMKPDAPSEIRGPFKPIRTKSDAFEISEILPLHAKIADKFSLVRSCYHTAAATCPPMSSCPRAWARPAATCPMARTPASSARPGIRLCSMRIRP
jgi:hypothetical protein